MMELNYDERADAAFAYVNGRIRPGTVDGTERLDEDRAIKYDAEDRILAYELLNVRRYGVRLDDLENRDELARVFREAGFAERGARRTRAPRSDAARRAPRAADGMTPTGGDSGRHRITNCLRPRSGTRRIARSAQ